MKWRARAAAAKQALLPKSLEEAKIGGMCTGDGGWAVPWAMWVDRERRCWLHPNYTIHAHRGGTVQMRVELRGDGYHVWTAADHRYDLNDEPGYVSPSDTEYLPVVELHRGD
jgi:hypothetical protein